MLHFHRGGWVHLGGRPPHSVGFQLQDNPSDCKCHRDRVAGGVLHPVAATGGYLAPMKVPLLLNVCSVPHW